MNERLIIPIFCIGFISLIPFTFAQESPNWIKDVAEWWIYEKIPDSQFVNTVSYLMKKDIQLFLQV